MKAKVLVAQFHPVLCNPMDAVPQAPLSMAFSRQEYRSAQPFHSPRDLPDPGIKSRSLVLWVDFSPSEPAGKPSLIPQTEIYGGVMKKCKSLRGKQAEGYLISIAARSFRIQLLQ